MGWFTKKIDDRVLAGLHQVVNEAYTAVPGSLADSRLVYNNAEVNLSDSTDMKMLGKSLSKTLGELPHNADNWSSYIALTERELKESVIEDDYRFRLSAFAILVSLVKTNLACKIANAYPKDKQVQKLVSVLVFKIADVLELGFPSKNDYESEVYALLNDFPHISEFLGRITGFNSVFE